MLESCGRLPQLAAGTGLQRTIVKYNLGLRVKLDISFMKCLYVHCNSTLLLQIKKPTSWTAHTSLLDWLQVSPVVS